VNRHLLDQYDFLGGYLILLQNPFQLAHARRSFHVLQCINDQYDVMVNDWLVGSSREPGAGPGRKALHTGLRETAEAVMKEIVEKKPLFLGKDRFALSQNGQPNSESVRQAFQRRG
jgi:hypothetical protein